MSSPHRPWWHRLHPAYLVYLILVALVVNVLLGELQTVLTNGLGAVYDGDWDFAHLANTATGRLATTYPIPFAAGLVVLLALAIVGYRHDRRLKQPTGKLPLIRARDLDRTTFPMGDDAAATRPYAESIVHAAFAQATNALRAAAASDRTHRSPKRGILVLGESNAGKTRLALEALIAALPRWPVLVWSPTYSLDAAPPDESLRGRKLVIFVDDLPDYVATPTPIPGSSATGLLTQSTALADPAATLRTLVANARTAAGKRGRVLLVVTCRTEGLERAKTGLAALFDELEQVSVPTFSLADRKRVVAALKVAEAAAGPDRHGRDGKQDPTGAGKGAREDVFDGTIGSQTLGLGRKQQEYEQLRAAGSPAVPVLHAMKLLAASGILAHTEPRLAAVCAAVFGQPALRDDPAAWQAAVADLTRLQFVSVATDPDDDRLVIRKDPAYYDRVITAYPDPAQPHQLDHDREALPPVFTDLGDDEALFSLGNTYYNLGAFDKALDAYDAALRLRPDDPATLMNKGNALADLGRPAEALDAYDAALRLRPDDPDTLYNKGNALARLGRAQEALDAYDAALRLRPDHPDTLMNKGVALATLGKLNDALVVCDRALALKPGDSNAWRLRALVLRDLGRTAEADAADARAREIGAP